MDLDSRLSPTRLTERVGRHVARRRKELGLLQPALVEALELAGGCGIGTKLRLSLMENGRARLNLDHIQALAIALSLEPWELVKGEWGEVSDG